MKQSVPTGELHTSEWYACIRKKKYPDVNSVRWAIHNLKHKKRLFGYWCQYCGYFHLTKSPKRTKDSLHV